MPNTAVDMNSWGGISLLSPEFCFYRPSIGAIQNTGSLQACFHLLEPSLAVKLAYAIALTL